MRTLRLPPPPAGGGGGGGVGIHRAALCVFQRFLGTTVGTTRLQEVDVSVPILRFFFSQRVSLLTGNKESKNSLNLITDNLSNAATTTKKKKEFLAVQND